MYGTLLPLDSLALISETLLVQHVVRLVQDKHSHLANVHLAATDQVHDCAWSTHDHMTFHTLATLRDIRNCLPCLQTVHELAHNLYDA